MDAVSYSLASKQAQRIEKFIENPDSTSGIVTVPKTIASGETVTVPAGRVAVLPNVVVDGTLNIDGEVFIPSGSSVDFSNGIKIDGENIALSIPTSYHLLEGNLSATINANYVEVSATTTRNYTTSDYIFDSLNNKLYDCISASTSGVLLTNTTYFTSITAGTLSIDNAIIPLAHGVDSNGSKNSIVIANETITGLTYTQGKNYLYKTDTGYGVKPYEPRYLSSELVRRFAGEQPDYYDVNSNKWFNTDAGSELVTNGKFISNIAGWTQGTSSTASYNSGAMRLTSINEANDGVYQNIATVVGRKYAIEFSVAFGTRDTITIEIDNNRIASISTVSGVKYLTFVANNTTTKLEFDTATSATGLYLDIDYVSVYPAIIVPAIEITESRNYLNHIVHADQNGQVMYVEELPKIEYKDVIKANEFKGKNACTAKALFDRVTYKLSGLYNIAGAINISTQHTDFIFEKEMDNVDYEVSIDCSFATFTSNAMTPYSFNKTTKGFRVTHYNTAGGGSNPSMVSIIVFGGKN